MNNMQLSALVIQKLLEAGVEEFCLCAGARNSPLIKTFSLNARIKVYHFFEERCASFFALGRMQLTKRPVAVVTTSGTAVAELLPATIEAHYQGLPLILLTADRPKTYRGSGAPQAIDHPGIFSNYVKHFWDLDVHGSQLTLTKNSFTSPLHINICFDEPLIDQEALQLRWSSQSYQFRDVLEEVLPDSEEELGLKTLRQFTCENKPLIIVSGLNSEDQEPVLSYLENLQCPLVLEATSGLRNHPRLRKKQLLVPEKMAKQLISTGDCQAIIRIGAVPTTRLWRDLEYHFKEIPVLVVSNTQFSGLSRSSIGISPISGLGLLSKLVDKVETPKKSDQNNSQNMGVLQEKPQWQEKDQWYFQQLNFLLEKYPRSEPALIRRISEKASGDRVYLGNSMPIREWDLVLSQETEVNQVYANRGANGIDGQISTFLGWAASDAVNWAIIGDLTALYDLAALWVTPQLGKAPKNIIVINNGGGMIFNKLFNNEYFLNRHQIEFSAWAQMWGWQYEKWEQVPENFISSGSRIIEVVPQEEQTLHFWQEWDKI